MTNKEALDILKDRKIAYEVVITRTASHENRHMAEEELKLINACIIALEHKEFLDNTETVDAIPIEEILKYIDVNAIKYIKISSLDFQDEYKVRAEVGRLFTDLINDWRKENESNSNS